MGLGSTLGPQAAYTSATLNHSKQQLQAALRTRFACISLGVILGLAYMLDGAGEYSVNPFCSSSFADGTGEYSSAPGI